MDALIIIMIVQIIVSIVLMDNVNNVNNQQVMDIQINLIINVYQFVEMVLLLQMKNVMIKIQTILMDVLNVFILVLKNVIFVKKENVNNVMKVFM